MTMSTDLGAMPHMNDLRTVSDVKNASTVFDAVFAVGVNAPPHATHIPSY